MHYSILILAFICGGACYFLAKSKKRSPWGWFFLGFFLNFIPLLILAILPDGGLEDELYELKTRMKLLENAKNREGLPEVKVQVTKNE